MTETFVGYNRVFIYSILIEINPDEKYISEILKMCLDGNFELYEQYYLRWQCIVKSFGNTKFSGAEPHLLSRKLYRQIYLSYLDIVGAKQVFVTKNNRDKNLTVVTTSQFLGMNHAPTKLRWIDAICLKKKWVWMYFSSILAK